MTAAPLPALAEPLVIVGAGPIGLAAAAHAHSRGLPTLVLEAGHEAGASVREWGHVRLFSPWRELVDPAAESLLASAGWARPTPTATPPAMTGSTSTSRRWLRPSTRPTWSRSGSTVVSWAWPSRAATGSWTPAGSRRLFTVHVESGSRRSPAQRPRRSSTHRAPGRCPTRWAPTGSQRWARPSTLIGSSTASRTSAIRRSGPATPESALRSPAVAPPPRTRSSV